MKRAATGGFSAALRADGGPRATKRTDPGAPAGVKRRPLLEMQWQGRGGQFHHVVLRPLGLRRTLVSSGFVALLVLAVVGAFSVGSTRALGHLGANTAMREGTMLNGRHEELREEAFDLAGQLYQRVEQGRRLLRMAHAPSHDWDRRITRPPDRDAGDDALLAWLSEQGARLEALGNELAAGRVETVGKQASLPAPVDGEAISGCNPTLAQVADLGSAGRQGTASTER